MHQAPTNLLLPMLPIGQRVRLMRVLEPVALPVRTVLYEPERAPHYVHFLTSGVAVLVTHMAEGDACEAGIVGHEGTPESLHLLGAGLVQTSCSMLIAGTGLRMKFKDFEQLFHADEMIRRVICSFVQYQNIVLHQSAACNRLHEIEGRFARWLLMIADIAQEAEMRLTQDFVSQMLGARRSTLTLTAGALQKRGLLEYARGNVHILDRAGLEDAACECYAITRTALNSFRSSNMPPPLDEFRARLPISRQSAPLHPGRPHHFADHKVPSSAPTHGQPSAARFPAFRRS